MTITRESLKAINADLAAALLEVGKKHGVLINTGGWRFTSEEAGSKITITAVSAETMAQVQDGASAKDLRNSKAADDYIKLAKAYGMDPAWLNKEFSMQGGRFTLIGLLPNKHKNVALIRRVSTGKQFITSSDNIVLAFA